MGLELKEQPRPDGSGMEVVVQPGYAWDGFGRPITLLASARLPVALFSTLVHETTDEPNGRAIPVWLRYDETAAQPPRAGFANCDDTGSFARVQEGYRFEIGYRLLDEQHDNIFKAGRAVAPQNANPDYTIADESIPYQELPASGERRRWLIPLGSVQWKPNVNSLLPGNFVARNAAALVASERQRRYIGAVVGSLEAAGKIIRLHDRKKPPSQHYPPAPAEAELVWVEGDLRVEGDARLFNGKLDFRNADGLDNGVPLLIQRAQTNADGGSLQIVTGKAANGAVPFTGKNTFEVGPLDVNNTFTPHLTVRDNGKIGIGTTAPTGRLTLQGSVPNHGLLTFFSDTADVEYDGGQDGLFIFRDTGGKTAFLGGSVGIGTTAPRCSLGIRAVRQGEELLSFEDPNGNTKWHINQNLGGNNSGLNFVETGVADGRLFIKAGGNVGIGTTTPAYALDVADRVRVREGKAGTAGILFFQNSPSADRAFVGMANNDEIGLWGPTASWGLVMNVNNGQVGVGTHSPADRLEVGGNLRVTDPVSGNALRFTNAWSGFPDSTSNRAEISNDTTSHRTLMIVGNRSAGLGRRVSIWDRLEVNGTLQVTGRIATGSYDADTGYPSGWAGGMHTFDLYAEGTVGVGSGGNLAAFMNRAGDAYKSSGPTWAYSSDERLKEKILPLQSALRTLLQLRGVSFYWKEPHKVGNRTGPQLGLIAQEVEKVLPEWVTDAPDGYKALAINGFEALVIEALRELHTEIEALKTSAGKSANPAQTTARKRQPARRTGEV
ncbi:MAG: tail fiber domain-containing protein [Blastocatellia bacterium]